MNIINIQHCSVTQEDIAHIMALSAFPMGRGRWRIDEKKIIKNTKITWRRWVKRQLSSPRFIYPRGGTDRRANRERTLCGWRVGAILQTYSRWKIHERTTLRLTSHGELYPLPIDSTVSALPFFLLPENVMIIIGRASGISSFIRRWILPVSCRNGLIQALQSREALSHPALSSSALCYLWNVLSADFVSKLAENPSYKLRSK